MSKRAFSSERGFTLIELVLVMSTTILIAAMLAPRIGGLMRSQRSKGAAQIIETQLQQARLKAVTVSRSLRVRLSCPSAGTIRTLEVTGVTATDNSTSRCNPVNFPFPGLNDSLRATPSLDGPVVYLPAGVTITGATTQFEFNPRGSVASVAADGTATLLSGDAVLTIKFQNAWTHTVTINALGRIRLD